MVLEYFPDGYEDGPLVLLRSGTAAEVSKLCEVFRSLSPRHSVPVHDLPFMTTPQPCTLWAHLSASDVGVVQINHAAAFDWKLSADGWDDLVWWLSPFAERPRAGTFQYLNQFDGPEVIYSTGRSW